MRLKIWDTCNKKFVLEKACKLINKEGIWEILGKNKNYITIPSTDLFDKNKKEIFLGDIILCKISSTNLVKNNSIKKYTSIPCYCEIILSRGCYETRFIKVCDGYEKIYKKGNYMMNNYNLVPLSEGSNLYDKATGKWDIHGDNKTCYNVEVVGSIYENRDMLL